MFFDAFSIPLIKICKPIMILNSLEKERCCGCSACSQICGKKALSMYVDDEGFVYPMVNTDVCNDCGLCEKVCPVYNSENVKNHFPQDAYVAINNRKDELFSSSSGGIFSIVANYVLDKGGIVCGAAFNEDFSVCHRIVERTEDLSYLRGSKYLFSTNNDCYTKVRAELRKGRLVYYTGTGCQIGGLKAFLMKEYDNLITSDILCHGTPSAKIFRAFLDYYEKKNNQKIVEYNFRDKKICGWSCSSSSSSMDIKTGKIKYVPYDSILDGYFRAFISGSINRESCYKCEFTTDQRSGDITLADYWGIEKYHPEIESLDGVSFLLVNTDKGRKIIESIKDKMLIKPTNPDWAAVINRNLRERTPRPERRNVVYEELMSNPEAVINSFMANDYGLSKAKFMMKRLLRVNDTIYRKLYTIKKHLK